MSLPKSLCIVVLLSFCAAACGGVKSRIREHEREFATYAPEVQAQIQSGRIDRGFTEDMVYLSKGTPDDQSSIDRDGRKVTIWKYARSSPALSSRGATSNLSSPYGYPGFGPGPAQSAPLLYERAYFKIEFEKGKVIGWDQDMQEDVEDLKMPRTPYGQ